MEQAGLANVKVVEYKTPIGTWEAETRPETRNLGAHFSTWMVEFYWHVIPRLVGDGKSAEEIERFRTQMIQGLEPDDVKYLLLYVTIGSKP